MLTSSYLPAAGRFLISEPFMYDPNFKRTVVLLAEHGKDGTVGFVLNRRLTLTINEIVEGVPFHEAPVFMGGPVEQNTLHYIHRLGNVLKGSQQIGENLYWGGQFETLVQMIGAGEIPAGDLIFFVGYSGWSAGQLDTELDRKSWIVAPENSGFVFQEDHEDLWRQILRTMGTKYEVLSNYPEDPRFN
jgi:putative transcriptional regulator